MVSFNHPRHVLVVLLAVGLGVVVPQAAHVVTSVTLLIVAFLVYSSWRGATIARGDSSRFLLPAVSVLTITYVVIPIVGISGARYLLSGDALLGAAVMLSAPATAGSAIVWTRLYEGNDELSGVTSIATIALAPLLTPFVLFWLVGHLHTLSVVGLASKLLLVIALAAGLSWIVPRDAVSDPTVEYGSMAAIALLIYAGVGGTGIADTSIGFFGRIASLVLVVFLAGLVAVFLLRIVSGRRRPDLLAVLFSGTLKNLGISLFVALSIGSNAAIHAVIVYYVGQQLLSALVVDGFGDGVLALTVGEP